MNEKLPGVIICPACGFQFKMKSIGTGENICPKCGHSFKDPDSSLREPKRFTNKKI